MVEVGQEGWWKAELKSGNTAVVTGEGVERAVREIDIYFQLSDGLRLRDLVPILGPYTKVFESKTAGVLLITHRSKGWLASQICFRRRSFQTAKSVE